MLLEPTEQAFLNPSIQKAVEATLRRKAEERHFTYTPIPVTSQRYRFMALNEMAKRLAKNNEMVEKRTDSLKNFWQNNPQTVTFSV